MADETENSLFYFISSIDNPALEPDQFDAICEAIDVRCVLINGGATLEGDLEGAREKISHIQSHDVAVLIANDPDKARSLGADGVHMDDQQDFAARIAQTNARCGDDAIKGVEVFNSRHDAMERADQNVDYIAFVDTKELVDMISWWAEIFEIPCVAWKVGSPELAAQCSVAGANFIAIDLDHLADDKPLLDVLTEFKTALHKVSAAA